MTDPKRPTDFASFANLDYEAFRKRAAAEGLSANERIGFPDSYREGSEEGIIADVLAKVPALGKKGARVLDVGCGCGRLPRLLAEHCTARAQHLALLDSAEMLAQLGPVGAAETMAGFFPREHAEWVAKHAGTFDLVLAYSVVQYAFVDTSIFDFVDACMQLLSPGGSVLLGDLPNASMRKRFLASASGLEFHRAWAKNDSTPELRFNALERGAMDDAVVLSLLSRARAAGFHAWVLPQAPGLPMANRREDVLIVRP